MFSSTCYIWKTGLYKKYQEKVFTGINLKLECKELLIWHEPNFEENKQLIKLKTIKKTDNGVVDKIEHASIYLYILDIREEKRSKIHFYDQIIIGNLNTKVKTKENKATYHKNI